MAAVMEGFRTPQGPQTPGGLTSTTSLPGTPLSGISTVAIKDGYEGNRHTNHPAPGTEYIPSSADRLARLGGFGPGGIAGLERERGVINSNTGTSEGGGNGDGGYFEKVTGWRSHLGEDTVGGSQSADVTPNSSTVSGSGSEREEFSATGNDEQQKWGPSALNLPKESPRAPHPTPISPSIAPGNQNLGFSRKPLHSLHLPPQPPIPPRRAPSSYSAMIPNPPMPTPLTPSLLPPDRELPKGPSLLNPLYQSLSSSITSATPTTSNVNTPNVENTPHSSTSGSTPAGAPSPASTVTTASVRMEKDRAKMIGPMTYDEGVVDTTDRSPIPASSRNASAAVLTNGEREKRTEDMDIEEDKKADFMEGVESTDINSGFDSDSTRLVNSIPGSFGGNN